VEDNAGDARLVREALLANSISCELIVVTNGQLAVDLIEEMDAGTLAFPDLVLVDLNVPRISGLEVVQRIRASKKCPATPVVILTSSDRQRDRDSVAGVSVARYIVKPSRLGDFMNLGRIFKELLNQSR
jgi:CheY-like chemotaxis protein